MILRSIELESFGRFRGQTVEFRRGLNLVIGPNEAGKSTIAEAVPAVLFGTDSFWEGIDVPGKALELVVIVRLPFAVPTEPIVQAQMEETVRKRAQYSFRKAIQRNNRKYTKCFDLWL